MEPSSKGGGGRRSGTSKAELEVSWVQGFTSKNVSFVNSVTVCYPCGNFVIFMDIDTRHRSFLRCPHGSIGAFAANASQHVIAFSDRQLNPIIYIYNFPALKNVAKLRGQASLDYSLLAFSHASTYLASYSSLPEFCLSIWNWHKKTLLCSQSQPGVEVTAMSFNPMSWHQLCLYNGTSVTIWIIERSHEQYLLKSRSVRLPSEDGCVTDEQNTFFSSLNISDPYFGPVLPNSAIAGLVSDDAETFRPKDDIQPTVHPTVHCWTPTSDLYMGCEEGYFLKIGADTFKAVIVSQKYSSDIKGKKQATFRTLSCSFEKAEAGRRKGGHVVLLAMALHKDGLYAAGSDGVVRFYYIKGTSFQMEDCLEMEESITSLTFSPDYANLLVETEKGSLCIFNPNEPENANLLVDASIHQFVAADFLIPGTKYCVSAAESGEVHVWQLGDGAFVSKLCLHTVVTSMACSLSSHTVAVGTKKGHVYFLDLTEVETPRVVHRVLLSQVPVHSLHYEQSGQFLITTTKDHHIFILNAFPTKSFQILGCVEQESEIIDIMSLYDTEKESVEVVVLLCPPEIKRARMEIFNLPAIIALENEECITERGLLKENIIEKRLYDFEHPLSSLVKKKDGIVFGYASQAPYILKYSLFSQITLKDQPVFVLEKKILSKQYGNAFLRLSPHGKWLASAAKSGLIFIHEASSMEVLAHEHCHSYNGQGTRSLAFSLDGQHLIANGSEDGSLVCLKWKKLGERRMKDASDFGTYVLNTVNNYICCENLFLKTMPDWTMASRASFETSFDSVSSQMKFYRKQTIETTVDDEYFLLTQARSDEISWIDEKAQKTIEVESSKFNEKRKEIKRGIKMLRKKIQEMLFNNAMAPKIEKLDQQEFNLDIEEKEKQQVHSEEEVERVRKDIELENLANSYLYEIIKQECWDAMSVKGRLVKSFHSPCEVHNYPMKQESTEEQQMLERILYLKKIEATDLKLRKRIVEFESQPSIVKEEGEKAEEEEEKVDTLVGSLSSHYGADTSLLYHQMELHTREEKISQIILLRDIIHAVKNAFNKDFDSVCRMKEMEIARVKDRNTRISEILKQLDIHEEIWVPTLADNEKPERILTVLDSEIEVEKYLTPVQKAKEKIMSRVHHKRRLAAQGDNARERGLMDMMNGVLEIRKEDILKMEIPAPAFISKEEALWNEEEKKLYKEYEKKVKELNEEREKHRKILETELRKLQGSIQETTQGFDEIVGRLFEKKINCEMVVYQEELKITNILYSLLLDEELSTREAGLHHYLNKKRKEKVISNEAVKTARAEVEITREAYDILIAEDKLMERGFRKEFSDLPTHHIDQLFKLYKRRPRALRTKVQADAANPYGDRPGSAKAYQDALAHLMKGIVEMDDPDNRPEGLDLSSWEHFCAVRRAKVESEQQMKQKALMLAEMQTFLQKRVEYDEKIRKDIDHVFSEINLLREHKMRFQINLMVQFLFKQGQVELEGDNLIPDYTDAILINRSIIEELNSVIRAQGERKVASMVESKDFRKGIFQLEWEHKKMQMQVEDLNQKARDIQRLNITKDHQIYLSVLNYDSRLNHEVTVMEGTLVFLDKVHKKNMEQREKVIKELEKQLSLKDLANQKLSKELQEMLVTVSERQHINAATDSEMINQKISKEHYEDIVQRQKLVDLAKAQAQEVNILQAEVERLRMRTFPAFFNVQEYDES